MTKKKEEFFFLHEKSLKPAVKQFHQNSTDWLCITNSNRLMIWYFLDLFSRFVIQNSLKLDVYLVTVVTDAA